MKKANFKEFIILMALEERFILQVIIILASGNIIKDMERASMFIFFHHYSLHGKKIKKALGKMINSKKKND